VRAQVTEVGIRRKHRSSSTEVTMCLCSGRPVHVFSWMTRSTKKSDVSEIRTIVRCNKQMSDLYSSDPLSKNHSFCNFLLDCFYFTFDSLEIHSKNVNNLQFIDEKDPIN
jgi:hypothetical protein